MLGKFWKPHVVNNLGADIDASSNSANEHCKLFLMPWKFTDGVLEYGSEITLTCAADIADGGSEALAAQDNDAAGELFTGLTGRIELSSDDSTHDGSVDVFIEFSNDDTTFPSDHANWDPEEDGKPMGSLRFDHDATGTDVKGTNIEFR